MSVGNDKQVDFKGDNQSPPPDMPPKETPKPGSPQNTGLDFGKIEAALREGRPLNIFGPMCSGKTTIDKILHDNYEYRLVEESAWEAIVTAFCPSGDKKKDFPDPKERLGFYSKIGEHLAPAYEAATLFVLQSHPEYLKKVIVNAWIPHLPEPFLNVYLMVRNDKCIQEERGWAGDAAGHYDSIRERAMKFQDQPNIIVVEGEQAREALTRYLTSGGDDE